MTTTELERTVRDLEDPVAALVDDELRVRLGQYQVKAITARVKHRFIASGGDIGGDAVQRFIDAGIGALVRARCKVFGYYDPSLQVYRSYVGSPERALRVGADYKIRKGIESVTAGRTQHKLADMLRDSGESVVTEDLVEAWRAVPDDEEGD